MYSILIFTIILSNIINVNSLCRNNNYYIKPQCRNNEDCYKYNLPFRQFGTNSGQGPPNRSPFISICLNNICSQETDCITNRECDKFSWSQRMGNIGFIGHDYLCDNRVCTEHVNTQYFN